MVCPWLLKELVELGLWDDDMKNRIIAHGGSVQNIDAIPADVKAIYKTVWEISQKKVIDLAADRGAFIDQSQSLNIHLTNPTFGQLTSMHFYGWRKGLKTGMYYLRTRPAAQAIQFTLSAEQIKEAKEATARGAAANKASPAIAAAASPAALQTPVKSAPAGGVAAVTNGVQKLTFTPSAISTPPPSVFVPESTNSTADTPTKAAAASPVSLAKTSLVPAMAATVAASTGHEVLPAQPASPASSDKVGGDDNDDITFEEAQKRAADRAEAALQCSIDNKDACTMCSG